MLQEKLLRVQAALKAPKSQWNIFGKYYYRNCEDILEAVKPLLLQEKLTLLISDEIKQIGDRYYIEAVATLTDAETSISVKAYAREEENKKGMDASQITGAASSYARKYALNGLFLIDDTKDSDSTSQAEKNAEKPQKNAQVAQQKPTRQQVIDKCMEIAAKVGVDPEEVRLYCQDATDQEVMRQYQDLVAMAKK